MQDKSIINAFLNMRLEAIRGDGEGLEHIDACLRLKGFDPADQHVPDHRPRRFGRGKLTRAIRDALRDGPKTGPEIVDYVAEAYGMDRETVRMSVHVSLSHGIAKGWWVKYANGWCNKS